ncbi:unnamed protein product, partial [Mesorhabditis spiculigera]
MGSWPCRLLLIFIVVASCYAQSKLHKEKELGKDEWYTYKQMCLVDGKLEVVEGIDCKQPIAQARWKNAVNASGWTFYEVETFGKHATPEQQAYSAGYLEGILSKPVVQFHIMNTVDVYCTNYTGYCNRLKTFMSDNAKWTTEQIQQAKPDDVYWSAVNRTYYQLSGLIDGFEGRPVNSRITLELHPITFINWNGDFYDLEKKLNKTADQPQTDGKCSGLVKVAPGNKDLFISQVTMSGFQNMLRVLKLYKFDYDKKHYPGYAHSMASYPGMLYSSDDFALMSSGLAIIETTISVFNNTLFEKTNTSQLPTWVRAIISNQLAHDGLEWCKIYSKLNSGTYNNQWVVLDYNKFTPGQPLANDSLLYILEQMPGTIIYNDLTWFLKNYSYFPSYNIPFFSKITEISGFIPHSQKLGDWFKWGKSPRAKIFDRDHGNVKCIDSLTKLMRYNNYQNDPFSKCNCTPPYSAEAGISARGDLNPADGKYEFPGMGHVNHGGLDYKGTNYEMMKKLGFRAWGGPTYDQVPAFKWSTFDFNTRVPHHGHPDEWKFEPFDHTWEVEVHTP